jgi:hypothetical protein
MSTRLLRSKLRKEQDPLSGVSASEWSGDDADDDDESVMEGVATVSKASASTKKQNTSSCSLHGVVRCVIRTFRLLGIIDNDQNIEFFYAKFFNILKQQFGCDYVNTFACITYLFEYLQNSSNIPHFLELKYSTVDKYYTGDISIPSGLYSIPVKLAALLSEEEQSNITTTVRHFFDKAALFIPYLFVSIEAYSYNGLDSTDKANIETILSRTCVFSLQDLCGEPILKITTPEDPTTQEKKELKSKNRHNPKYAGGDFSAYDSLGDGSFRLQAEDEKGPCGHIINLRYLFKKEPQIFSVKNSWGVKKFNSKYDGRGNITARNRDFSMMTSLYEDPDDGKEKFNPFYMIHILFDPEFVFSPRFFARIMDQESAEIAARSLRTRFEEVKQGVLSQITQELRADLGEADFTEYYGEGAISQLCDYSSGDFELSDRSKKTNTVTIDEIPIGGIEILCKYNLFSIEEFKEFLLSASNPTEIDTFMTTIKIFLEKRPEFLYQIFQRDSESEPLIKRVVESALFPIGSTVAIDEFLAERGYHLFTGQPTSIICIYLLTLLYPQEDKEYLLELSRDNILKVQPSFKLDSAIIECLLAQSEGFNYDYKTDTYEHYSGMLDDILQNLYGIHIRPIRVEKRDLDEESATEVPQSPLKRIDSVGSGGKCKKNKNKTKKRHKAKTIKKLYANRRRKRTSKRPYQK